MTKQLSKAFKARNARFNAASPAEQRVIVAKDVIAQIKKGSIEPMRGNWVRMFLPKMAPESQICDIVGGKNDVVCSACALGSMMISMVRYRDNFSVRDYELGNFNYDSIHYGRPDKTGITELFTPQQQRMIECAFEAGDGFYNYSRRAKCSDTERKEMHKAIDFGYQYTDTKARLIAIMKNIVKNKGEFVP